jgi:imidazolonepropionase-like amidohydrolase
MPTSWWRLTKRGMPPLEAIRAATLNAAELLSWQDRVGAVEADKYADLIAVEGDPLTKLGRKAPALRRPGI